LRVEQQAAEKVKDTAQPMVDDLTDTAKEVAGNLKEPGQQAMEEVKSTATDAAAVVKDDATSAVDDVKTQAQDSKRTVQGAAKQPTRNSARTMPGGQHSNEGAAHDQRSEPGRLHRPQGRGPAGQQDRVRRAGLPGRRDRANGLGQREPRAVRHAGELRSAAGHPDRW